MVLFSGILVAITFSTTLSVTILTLLERHAKRRGRYDWLLERVATLCRPTASTNVLIHYVKHKSGLSLLQKVRIQIRKQVIYSSLLHHKYSPIPRQRDKSHRHLHNVISQTHCTHRPGSMALCLCLLNLIKPPQNPVLPRPSTHPPKCEPNRSPHRHVCQRHRNNPHSPQIPPRLRKRSNNPNPYENPSCSIPIYPTKQSYLLTKQQIPTVESQEMQQPMA